MISKIKKIFHNIGIDGAIAITVFTRLIQAGGGLISVLLIARFLTSTEQGFYYTFSSVLAIQVFFELGLSGIITQYAAHEFAHLELNKKNFTLTGDKYYKSRLSSLLQFCVKCFSTISIILFFVLLFVGFYYFNAYNKNIDIEWKKPWILLCLTTSLNLFIDPLLGFFDGMGEVKDMAKVRLLQRVFYIVFIFLFFFLGFKLYSAALASLISILINYVQIISTGRIKILKSLWKEKGNDIIDYYKEIFPLQWRIALSWISGFFIFQLFNVVLFATDGATIAGQMGMTLAALLSISTLTMSWINTKVPLFSGLIAQNKFTELDTVFDKTLKQLIGITILLVAIFIVFIIILQKLHLPLLNRFLPMLPLLLLCSTIIANQFVFCWATYLRCHKKEPYLLLSIVNGVLCCLSTFLLGHKLGLMGIVGGYTFLMLTVSLFWGYYIFKKKKHEWHSTKDLISHTDLDRSVINY